MLSAQQVQTRSYEVSCLRFFGCSIENFRQDIRLKYFYFFLDVNHPAIL